MTGRIWEKQGDFGMIFRKKRQKKEEMYKYTLYTIF